MKSFAALSAVLLTLAVLPGEELKIREVRLGMTYSPVIDSVKTTWGPNSQTFANKEDYIEGTTETGELTSENPGWKIHLVESFGTIKTGGGLVFGLSFGQAQQTTHGEDHRLISGFVFDQTLNNGNGGYIAGVSPLFGPVTTTATSFDVHLAYAIGITSHIHCELGGFVGGGTVSFEDVQPYEKNNNPSKVQALRSTGGGNYHEVGLEFTAVATFNGGFQTGLTVSFVRAQGENTLHLDGSNADVSYDSYGFGGEIFIGYRF